MDRKSEFGTARPKISISFKTCFISTPPAYVTVKKNLPFSLNDIENIRPYLETEGKKTRIYNREMYYSFSTQSFQSPFTSNLHFRIALFVFSLKKVAYKLDRRWFRHAANTALLCSLVFTRVCIAIHSGFFCYLKFSFTRVKAFIKHFINGGSCNFQNIFSRAFNTYTRKYLNSVFIFNDF